MADTKISAASRLTGTGAVKRPVVLAGSTTAFSIQDNYEATTDPGLTDDSAAGYSIGSSWLNKTTMVQWVAMGVGASAAVWVPHDDPVSFIPKGYYTQVVGWGGLFGSAATANRLNFLPVVIPAGFTADRISIIVNAAVVGNARLGIYKNRPGVNLPGLLVLDAGAVSTNVAAGEVSITISQSLPPGKYWLAVVLDAAGNIFRASSTLFSLGGASIIAGGLVGTSGLYRAFTYAALPADESSKVISDYSYDSASPYVGLRRA